MKKNYLFTDRFIFENAAPKENTAENGKIILDRFSETAFDLTKQRLQLGEDIGKNFKEDQKHAKIVAELIRERTPDPEHPELLVDVSRDLQVFGKTVHMEWKKDGNLEEFVDGKPIDFTEWARTQNNDKFNA